MFHFVDRLFLGQPVFLQEDPRSDSSFPVGLEVMEGARLENALRDEDHIFHSGHPAPIHAVGRACGGGASFRVFVHEADIPASGYYQIGAGEPVIAQNWRAYCAMTSRPM